MPRPMRELRVIGCVPFDKDIIAGFALPVFEHPEHDALLTVQEIDEYLNVIASFKTLEGDLYKTIPVQTDLIARVGAAQIHAFITEDGTTHVGTLAAIEPTLRAFVKRFPERRAISLQVMELVGTAEEKRAARGKMRQLISDRAGAAAARLFYQRSALCAAIWARLIAAAPNPAAARRILSLRSRINPRMEGDRQIKIDLRDLDPADYSGITVAELAADLQREFEFLTENAIVISISESISSPTEEQRDTVTRALKRISEAGRQEERLAILMDEILKDKEKGFLLLLQYKEDRGKFATRALRQILGPVFSTRARPVKDEQIMASFVPKLYTLSFPMSRGLLLYFLGKHLGKYRVINRAIKRRLDHSKSMFVSSHRTAIEGILKSTLPSDT
jgi:hypothetical protein